MDCQMLHAAKTQLTWLEVAADVSSVVGRDESAAADPLLLAASCLVSVRLA